MSVWLFLLAYRRELLWEGGEGLWNTCKGVKWRGSGGGSGGGSGEVKAGSQLAELDLGSWVGKNGLKGISRNLFCGKQDITLVIISPSSTTPAHNTRTTSMIRSKTLDPAPPVSLPVVSLPLCLYCCPSGLRKKGNLLFSLFYFLFFLFTPLFYTFTLYLSILRDFSCPALIHA